MRTATRTGIILGFAGILGLLIFRLLQPSPPLPPAMTRPQPLDLAAFPDRAPAKSLRLLFIHHSCGGQLLAAPGENRGANGIYTTHPNAGDLRQLLTTANYEVHEAAYGCKIGENTDVFDWLPKFRTQMDDILRCDHQDQLYPDGRRNRIVMFKSCYPNNDFLGEGTAPGNPAGPELTVWNARATYAALLAEFQKQPDTLFVCLTAPPLAPKQPPQPAWKAWLKKLLGREKDPLRAARHAAQFNHWLADRDGWLKDYPLKNVVVFDHYGVLTADRRSDFSSYATGDGYDSHPSTEGNARAAAALVPFLNRAVQRATLTP